MEITGKDLHEAMQKGCIKDCRNCFLGRWGNCALKWKTEWEKWAREEHIKFEDSLKDEQISRSQDNY